MDFLQIKAQFETLDLSNSGWHPIMPEDGADLRRELHMEIAPGHMLYGVPVEVIARHDDPDYVLLMVDHEEFQLAVVHLTWRLGRERYPQWPATWAYYDVQHFIEVELSQRDGS